MGSSSTISSSTSETVTKSVSNRQRGLTPWQPGQSGNPAGRPRGLFSRRVLAEARRRGEDKRAQIDRVAAAMFDKAAGATDGKHDFRKADLAAMAFLRDTIDGPLQRNINDTESANGAPQVMVIVRNIANEPAQMSREADHAKHGALSSIDVQSPVEPAQ